MGESGAVRTNISLPRDLKARMDKVKDPVNWSAVAAEAFERKLVELASRKGAKNMDEVIARLKAAEQLESNEDYQAGREAGEEWARSEATPKELRALERLATGEYAREYDIEGYLAVCTNGMNHGIAHGLYGAIHPKEGRDDWDGIESFWEQVLGDAWRERIEDHDFARGFCEGALAVWEQVQDKL